MRKNGANADLRAEIAKRGLFLWEAARRIGVADTTFCRWLREEMTPEEKTRILRAIDGEGAADGTEKTQVGSKGL